MCDWTQTTQTVIHVTSQGPHLARQFAARALCSRHGAHLSTEAMLVASSFATNALLSGHPVTLELQCWEHAMVITALDPGGFDVRREARRRQVSMLLLDGLAQAWAAEPTRDGTGRRQWALLVTDPSVRDLATPGRFARTPRRALAMR